MSVIGVGSTLHHCHLTLLPRELLILIVDYLDLESRCSVRCTCKMLHAVSNDCDVWRHRVAVMSDVAQYNERMWTVIGERRLRQLALPTNVALTRDHWSSICQYCPDLEQLQASSCSLRHLGEARARSFYKLTVLKLRSDDYEPWVNVPWPLDRLPALSYLTLSCRSLTTDPVTNLLVPLTKLQGITIRTSPFIGLTDLVPFLNQSPGLHHLDINGFGLNGNHLLGSAGCKLPERHLQLQSLSVFTFDDDDFDWLPQLTNLTSLSLQSSESVHWEKLFSAITQLLKLKHLKLKMYDDSGPVVIPDHLPPLVSFELDIWPNYHEWDESMQSLPSLCTRVAASLKNFSLTMALTSSNLQYIGDHLPLLEVLQFRAPEDVDSVSQSALQSLLKLRKLREVTVISISRRDTLDLGQLYTAADYDRIIADPTLALGRLYTASDHRIRVTQRPDSCEW